MAGHHVFFIWIASLSFACTARQGEAPIQNTKPKPIMSASNKSVDQGEVPPRGVQRPEPKSKTMNSSPATEGMEDLLRQLPAAILDKSKFIGLLPPESSLNAAMKCTDKNPLVAVRARTVSSSDKNIESARKRVGLGIVTYGGFDTVKVQNIKKGEVDKGCSVLKNIEVQILKLKMNFIGKNGAQKTSFGRVNVIRIGSGAWHLLKM